MKQNVTPETNTDETFVSYHATQPSDEAVMVASGDQVVQARTEQRKQQRQRIYYRMFFRIAVLVAVLWLIGFGMVKGYGALKNAAGKEVAIMRFEQALKEKDMITLKKYIRIPDPTMSVNKKTLAPLFAYLDTHPQAYEKLHSDLEKQWKSKHVYIKGLTSQPPIFFMKVYEKQFFLLNQYIFEPTLYSLVVHVEEENVTLLVNGKKVQDETEEPFSRKIGSYLPGVYEITAVKKEGEETVKKTKKVVLFGGQRVHEVHF